MSRKEKAKQIAVLLGLLALLPAAAWAQGMMGGGMSGRGMMNGGMMGGGMMRGASPRQVYVMRHGVPADYAGMSNPLRASRGNVEAGKALYGQMCASCHGPAGRGDGAAGRGLNPPPPDLARAVRMRMASDGYLYWSIAEGGAAFNTAMPAMKAGWKPAQIWQVILFLRAL